MYQINEDTSITILQGRFAGVRYKYGRVEMIPEDDQLRVKFEYDVQEGEVTDKEDFRECVGDILTELIDTQIQKNEVVYTGGVD